MTYTLSELAAVCGARVVGDPAAPIEGVGTLQEAGEGRITFLTNRKYRKQLESSRASAVILTEADLPACTTNALVTPTPHVAYARITRLFAEGEDQAPGIHPSAVIEADAQVDPTATIGPFVAVGAGAVIMAGVRIGSGCSIGTGVRIGRDSRLYPNVTVYHGCVVGERAIVHAGAVIGSDGFGFANERGTWVKVYQLGGVRIGDDVEIGANTTIDRGAVNDTVIEDGVKLDNQIQVAHNVHVGAHTAIAGCVGIAGSATIGRHCAIGGGAGILGHLEIVDGVTVTAMSLVTKSIRTPGVYSSGTPLEPSDEWQKNFVRFKQLDDMARRLRQLEHEISELKKGSTT